ncbi:sugar phosphate isomerase/epimerase [Clostridium sp. SYSU_GA19001]|uniref:sugar phosphate isomerase/epimerase family protein n=1 Tax=Clostridium caldaquaticum TaxID=2940653 RepID=UPI0020776786|nr:TIM barrel protein [Clostridium caldaquaticum]MCM8709985.1 sugar phosphate isomerase/epimerase [Clostridium caldaquaticum]
MSKIKTCVSLYSLQDEYLNKRMTLEDIFKFLADNSVEGIEFLPDQMMHNAPHPSEETLAEWDRLVSTYKMKPVIADVFLNTNLYKNRELTKRECVDLLIEEIKLANRLGMKLIRLVSMVPDFVIEPLLPYCEKYDVTIALEIHAGLSFDVKKTQDFIAEMKRVNSPYVGLVVDTGIFCRRLPRVMANYCKNVLGTNQEVIDYINKIFEEGRDPRKVYIENNGFPEDLKKLIKSDADQFFAHFADGYENEPYSVLDEYMPYIKHFHFKLFEMTESGEEYSIDYRGILQYLHDKGYDGYVSTEYEGNRWVLPGNPMVEKEQVIAHQKLIREALKEIQG